MFTCSPNTASIVCVGSPESAWINSQAGWLFCHVVELDSKMSFRLADLLDTFRTGRGSPLFGSFLELLRTLRCMPWVHVAVLNGWDKADPTSFVVGRCQTHLLEAGLKRSLGRCNVLQGHHTHNC